MELDNISVASIMIMRMMLKFSFYDHLCVPLLSATMITTILQIEMHNIELNVPLMA